MNVDIAKLLVEGKTATEIEMIVREAVRAEQERLLKEAAKAEAAKIPDKTEIATRVANGTVTTKDVLVIVLDYAKVQIPEIAEAGELDIDGETLNDLVEIIDLSIAEARKEVVGMLQLAKMMGVDPKEALAAKTGKKQISNEEAAQVLAQLKNSLKNGGAF